MSFYGCILKTLQWTYDDITGPVVQRVQTMVDPSMINAWNGDGYMFVFSSLQGDWKFIKDQYKLHNYRANLFCSTCGVPKKDTCLSYSGWLWWICTACVYPPKPGRVCSQPMLDVNLRLRRGRETMTKMMIFMILISFFDNAIRWWWWWWWC